MTWKVLAALLLLLPWTHANATDSLRIVATTTQASDLARILSQGVEGVAVTALMGAGVDPHLYQPTESDIVALNSADMVVYSGLRLEGQFDALVAALGEQGIAAYALAQPVKDAGFIIGGFDLGDDYSDVDDPHFWFDPRNWEITAAELAEALAELDPENAASYRQNAEAFIARLQTLFDWADAGMRSIDISQRYLVTSHDAFQYLGAAFGWRLHAIQGLSTEDEAGVGDIQATVDFVIENAIPALFVESSIPPDTVDAVIEAVAAQGKAARVGLRELYGDAMDDPDSFGGTYIGMLATNVLTILHTYQCMGAPVEIPDWSPDLQPTPPPALLNPDCDA